MSLQPDQNQITVILDNSIGPKDWVPWIIGGLTLLLLAWYTYKTHQMQKTMARQTSLSILPAFVLEIRGNDPAGSLVILNIGNGIGINVTIDRLNLNPGFGFEDDLCPNIVFKRAIFLAKNEWGTIEHEQFYGNKKIGSGNVNDPKARDLLHELREENAGNSVYTLQVRFQDIEGNKYMQLITMGKGGCTPGPVKPDTKKKV